MTRETLTLLSTLIPTVPKLGKSDVAQEPLVYHLDVRQGLLVITCDTVESARAGKLGVRQDWPAVGGAFGRIRITDSFRIEMLGEGSQRLKKERVLEDKLKTRRHRSGA